MKYLNLADLQDIRHFLKNPFFTVTPIIRSNLSVPRVTTNEGFYCIYKIVLFAWAFKFGHIYLKSYDFKA